MERKSLGERFGARAGSSIERRLEYRLAVVGLSLWIEAMLALGGIVLHYWSKGFFIAGMPPGVKAVLVA